MTVELMGLEKDKPESQFVYVNFGKNKHESEQKYKNLGVSSPQVRKDSLSKSNSSNKSRLEDSVIKERLKTLALVMRKEINRIHHPFWKLNKTFAEYCLNELSELLPAAEEAYESFIQRLILEWCSYLECTCLWVYRKWIIQYTGIPEAKYKKWLTGIVLQEIWSVNNGYLYNMISIIINSRKTPLTINIEELQYNSSLLTPTLFNIDKKLQIEGHFFDSIYEMS